MKIVHRLSKVGVVHDTRPSTNAFAIVSLLVCAGRVTLFILTGN